MPYNDIVKALECCADADCLNCPRWTEEWTSGMCADFLPIVLDLVKRQQAEIERLQNALMGECMLTSCPLKKEIKSEAIKEFADRIKKNISKHRLFVV